MPPSTFNIFPVDFAARGEAKNSTASVTCAAYLRAQQPKSLAGDEKVACPEDGQIQVPLIQRRFFHRMGGGNPAFETTMSTPPKVSTVSRNAEHTAAALLTSAPTASARPSP